MFIASSSGSSGPKSPEAAGPRTRRCRHARVRSHRSKRHNVTATGNASFGLRGVFECATTPPRSTLPGCLGPYGSEGVRTVGRLHPGHAGERLLKQRPKINAELSNLVNAASPGRDTNPGQNLNRVSAQYRAQSVRCRPRTHRKESCDL